MGDIEAKRDRKRPDRRPLEEIVCVFGPPNAGKSTLIETRFPIGTETDSVTDIYSFQTPELYPRIATFSPFGGGDRLKLFLSQALFEATVASKVARACSHGTQTGRIVVEGTYLRRARRAPLLQSIRNSISSAREVRIRCIWVMDESSKALMVALDGTNIPFDMPDATEGFDEVEIVRRDDVAISDAEELERLREVCCDRAESKSTDVAMSDPFGYRELIRRVVRMMEDGEGIPADPDAAIEEIEGRLFRKRGEERHRKHRVDPNDPKRD